MVLGILLAIVLQAPAQAPAPPPANREANSALMAPPTTATVRGKIVAKDNGSPLAHAHVLLRQTGASPNEFTATADQNGTFEIRNIGPGTYSTRAAKEGFVAASRQTESDEINLKLAAGQIQDVEFRLARTGVIAGTVTTMDGEPLVDATVQAMVKVYRQGHPELQMRGGNVNTDDHGDFRLYDLPAGRYYVQAGKRAFSFTSSQGFVPYSTIIYPNASGLDGSQVIAVAAGEERRGINITLPQVPGYTVSGKVEDAEGKPITGMYLYMRPATNGIGINSGGMSGADGTFRLLNLPAGEYYLSGNVPQTPGKGSGAPTNFQRALEITSSDITGLTIRMSPGATVRGKVQAQGGDLPAKVMVSVSSRTPSGRVGAGHTTVTAPDGSFAIDNVEPGSWELVIAVAQGSGVAANSFFLSAATAGGQNAMDVPFTIPEGAGSVEVAATIDFRSGEIKGKTLDADGNPLPTTGLALVSADPKKRLITRYSRRLKSGKDGAFRLWNIIPGDYFVVIWAGDDPEQVLDPDVWLMLEKHAIPVKVERSAKMTQDLRMTKELKTIADAFAQ